MIDNTKIAKSLGNGIRLQGLIDRGYPAEAYRYFLLTGHYRSQMNFTFEALDAAKQALFRLKRYMVEEWKDEKGKVNERYLQLFSSAVADDLDTPKAVALLWEAVKDSTLSQGEKAATLRKMDEVLGLGLSDDSEKAVRELGVVTEDEIPPNIQKLVEEREEARENKNWDEADRLREAINLEGYAIEDTPQGPKITRA